MGFMGLHHVLGSTMSWDMLGEKVPHDLPKKQYRERHLLHSPSTLLLYCMLDSASRFLQKITVLVK